MEKKAVIVEYLIILLQEDTFCDSEKAFLKFLSVDSRISISEKEKTITLLNDKKKKFSVSYALKTGLVPSQAQRYFQLTLSSDEESFQEYTALTNLLEKLFQKLHDDVSVNLLWSDISRKYALEGYELINEVENLLRRLITSFMLINVGYDWHKYHVPLSVGNRGEHLRENYSDYLHHTYFSDLKTILFEGQRDFSLRNIGQVQILIERYISKGKKQISLDELTGVISTSLWEKHFSKTSKYKKKDLEEDLEKLNSLRNEIAHNRHITRETLGKIQNLSKKVITTLKLEISDLPNKKLSPEEQKFQIDIELSRLSEYNVVLQGYIFEKAVVEWYQERFGLDNVKQNVTMNFRDGTSEVDVLVTLGSEELIGVEVKGTDQSGFDKIINQIQKGKYIDRFVPRSLREFKEFHVVLVIREYSVGKEILFAEELIEVFNSVDAKIKVIIGYIDGDGLFQQI